MALLKVATNQQSHGSKCAMFCHLGPVPSGYIVVKRKPCLPLLGVPLQGQGVHALWISCPWHGSCSSQSYAVTCSVLPRAPPWLSWFQVSCRCAVVSSLWSYRSGLSLAVGEHPKLESFTNTIGLMVCPSVSL